MNRNTKKLSSTENNETIAKNKPPHDLSWIVLGGQGRLEISFFHFSDSFTFIPAIHNRLTCAGQFRPMIVTAPHSSVVDGFTVGPPLACGVVGILLVGPPLRNCMLSAKMEDYLKAIYEIKQREGEPVSTSSLASLLDVTAPTATSMMEKLEERGFVEREKYKGVELTQEGETVALEVIRHHRLLETYLADQLGYDWAEVHDEADRLEHHISEEFERRVAEMLDDPVVDPHGDPIPNDALEPVAGSEDTPLSDHREGDTVVVERVSDRDPEELSYLQEVGITPGTELTISEIAPIGMITVTLDGQTPVSLPDRIADSIWVSPSGDALEDPTELRD